MLKFKRPHYAWAICLGGTLAIFAAFGLCGNMVSFFYPNVIAERQFTNTQTGLLTTTRQIFILVSLAVVNRLCDRLGPRRLIALGGLCLTVGYLGLAFAPNFWVCIGCTALMGLGYSFAGVVPVAALFVRWFETDLSLAMGISSAASGAAMLVAPPILTAIMKQWNLTGGFLFMSLLCLALTVVIFLLLRNTPEECSMQPYHRKAPAKAKDKPVREPEHPPYTNAFHNAIILTVVFLIAVPVGVGVNNISLLLSELKYDEMLVATAVSAVGLFMIIGKILGAEMYDLVGGRLGNYILGGVFLAGLVLLLFSPSHNIPLLFVGLLLYGFGIPLGSVATYQWGSDLYGSEGYAKAVQVFSITYNVGALIFSYVPGILADHMGGSYMPAFILFTVIAVVCIVLLQWLYHHLDIGKRPG
ncbi:MAG: MFS transporter [Ruminococcaceae bacterium]|nr:MFS transporter [Oscillospiraceae bacterium]